ncbi:MAG TPA: hypothetical protein VFE33_01440 [Thermoanaerobaculia bacterium]|nr:hypothetical protein [Thermoanaerobaculia bacterium]
MDDIELQQELEKLRAQLDSGIVEATLEPEFQGISDERIVEDLRRRYPDFDHPYSVRTELSQAEKVARGMSRLRGIGVRRPA